jgi:hypothetical protein
MVTALSGLVRIRAGLAESLKEKGHETVHVVATSIKTRYTILVASKAQSK